jgi:hypothetical protein
MMKVSVYTIGLINLSNISKTNKKIEEGLATSRKLLIR